MDLLQTLLGHKSTLKPAPAPSPQQMSFNDYLQGHAEPYPTGGKYIEPLSGDSLPLPPPAPDFRPYPTFVGPQDKAKDLHTLLKYSPELMGRTPKVVSGHTGASMEDHIDSKLPADAFGHTTLMGITDHSRKNEVGINPTFGKKDFDETLAHEMTHTAGLDEAHARKASDLYYPQSGQVNGLLETLVRRGLSHEQAQKLLDVVTK